MSCFFHEEEPKTVAEQIEYCKKEIEECSEIINSHLKEKTSPNRILSLKNLHKRAIELNSKFGMIYLKFIEENDNAELSKKYSEVSKDFTELIHVVASVINTPENARRIYRNYSADLLRKKSEDADAEEEEEVKEVKKVEKKKEEKETKPKKSMAIKIDGGSEFKPAHSGPKKSSSRSHSPAKEEKEKEKEKEKPKGRKRANSTNIGQRVFSHGH